MQAFKTPIFSSLIGNRPTAISICAFAAAQVALTALGITGWICPILAVTGFPCPGCGLSRATAALLRGDWELSLTLHAFAPILLAATALLGISCFLPPKLHQKMSGAFEKLERRTGLTAILLLSLMIYWLFRLYFPATLALVVQR